MKINFITLPNIGSFIGVRAENNNEIKNVNIFIDIIMNKENKLMLNYTKKEVELDEIEKGVFWIKLKN